ncbi:MAG: N-acetylmuramoyl-L-alanine amidase [Bacteroidetes bacterium]|nr:N-acetylmuramoyl-L-alanine amidase [Bacteroidota bacterium]MBS1649418.1 N-acetylmuramoyl-L-alanine amidase [Bacteroidota bacterium]
MNKIILLITCLAFTIALKAQEDTSAKHYWLAKTKGKLPSLAYGLGDDRLGGAKLGYIDTNVILKVIDSTGHLYHVQLSKNHTAFIDKSYIHKDSTIKEKPFYLTNSWKVNGTDSCYDILAISVDERLPYKSWMEINPSKIMLQIYGVQSNTNWITQLQSLKEIKNVYYKQVEDDVVEVTIDLKHQQHWGYSIEYKGKHLIIKVKHQPEVLNLKKLVVAIDAGHGGNNLGTDGINTKASEKILTLAFAKALEKILKANGVKTIMTRTTDTSFDIKDRVLFLQEKNPDMLISLHLNSSSNTTINGSSTYYKHIGFRTLSQSILKRMLEIKMNDFGNVGSFNFTLNTPTDFVNALLEIGFLSNAEDEKKIITTKFQNKVALQVYKALKDWVLQVKTQKLN